MVVDIRVDLHDNIKEELTVQQTEQGEGEGSNGRLLAFFKGTVIYICS